MAKGIGFGTSLSVAATSGARTIGQIRGISGPDSDATDVETTTMDTTTRYETFVPATINPGNVTLDIVYDPGLESHRILKRHQGTGELATFTITHATTTFGTQAFSAYVAGLGQEIPMKDVVSLSVRLKVSGDPGFATT